MQQDLEGGETRARPPRASKSITQLCSDPRTTRDRAELGEPTPCHRCLAYEPDTSTGCLFLERHPMKLEGESGQIEWVPAGPDSPNGHPGGRTYDWCVHCQQQTLFHTPDTMERR